MVQLDPQQRRLHFVQARVHALHQVPVLDVRPVVAQHPDLRGQRGIVGGHRAAVAERAQVLAGEETETGGVAETSGMAPVQARAVRLRRVLDQQQAMLPRQGSQRGHVRQLAIQVHRHDRPRARADRALHAGRIQVEAERVRLHRHRQQPVLADRQEAGDEGVARHDHLVAVAQPAQFAVAAQDQAQRVHAVAHADRMFGAAIAGERALERVELLAQHVPARVDDPCRRGLQCVGIAGVERAQVQERHAHRRSQA